MANAYLNRFAHYTHTSPAYTDESPAARYEAMLVGLAPDDREFVLREAALLSEFADKCSWYATEDPSGAQTVVEGLVNEINAAAGKPVMTREGLQTDRFLNAIGLRESFEVDLELAATMQFDLEFPSRDEAFARMPDHYGRAFEANLPAFQDESAGRQIYPGPDTRQLIPYSSQPNGLTVTGHC